MTNEVQSVSNTQCSYTGAANATVTSRSMADEYTSSSIYKPEGSTIPNTENSKSSDPTKEGMLASLKKAIEKLVNKIKSKKKAKKNAKTQEEKTKKNNEINRLKREKTTKQSKYNFITTQMQQNNTSSNDGFPPDVVQG